VDFDKFQGFFARNQWTELNELIQEYLKFTPAEKIIRNLYPILAQ
jgi:hypothetical protein